MGKIYKFLGVLVLYMWRIPSMSLQPSLPAKTGVVFAVLKIHCRKKENCPNLLIFSCFIFITIICQTFYLQFLGGSTSMCLTFEFPHSWSVITVQLVNSQFNQQFSPMPSIFTDHNLVYVCPILRWHTLEFLQRFPCRQVNFQTTKRGKL